MNIVVYLYLFAGGVILTIGDIVMKKWALSDRTIFYVIGLILYLIGSVFLVATFKEKNMAIASSIYVIFNVVTLSLVSWLYFKEALGIYQIIGIVLALVSIFIMEIK